MRKAAIPALTRGWFSAPANSRLVDAARTRPPAVSAVTRLRASLAGARAFFPGVRLGDSARPRGLADAGVAGFPLWGPLAAGANPRAGPPCAAALSSRIGGPGPDGARGRPRPPAGAHPPLSRRGRRRLGVRLEVGRTARALWVVRGDEAAAVRADEQETGLALLQGAIRIPVSQLFRVAEAGLEQLQGFLAAEPEGSAEPDDGLVDDKGPAVRALRLVRRHGLRADGTQDPGLLPGHRRRIRPVPRTINPRSPLSAPIVGRPRS